MPVMRVAAFLGCLLGVLAGCAGPENPSITQSYRSADDKSATAGPATQNDARNGPQNRTGSDPAITPRIVRASRKLQCVPYARRHVDIALRGEAWTWWNAAQGRSLRQGPPAADGFALGAQAARQQPRPSRRGDTDRRAARDYRQSCQLAESRLHTSRHPGARRLGRERLVRRAGVVYPRQNLGPVDPPGL